VVQRAITNEGLVTKAQR